MKEATKVAEGDRQRIAQGVSPGYTGSMNVMSPIGRHSSLCRPPFGGLRSRCAVGPRAYALGYSLAVAFGDLLRHPFPAVAPLWVALICFGCNFFESHTETPGGLASMRLPEGFTIEIAAGPELCSYAMFGTLDQRGRLFLSEATGPNEMTTEEMLEEPSYRIRRLEDVDGDGIFDKSTIFADQIPLPQGGIWHDGSFYVAASPDLLRFADPDDDGVADRRETVLTGWTLNVNAATLHGPFFGPDGWLYLTDARRGYRIETKEGTILEGKGPRIWRCRPDGTGLEVFAAGGFDNPVELVFTRAGEMIGTMTYFVNPRAGERDALMHWVEGGVYPKPHAVIEQDRLKRTGDLMPVMTKFARVAPSGLVLYRSRVFGAEFQGNLFSVQFNTHRVLRHIVSRAGATFQTNDEEFLTSADPDFHPTDVLEDADGSLLVIDTGGWFIKGCPVSRVSKPEFQGAIYRIRKENAPVVRDPRGFDLKLETLAADVLATHMEDARPAVRDRAVELLVRAGNRSVEPLRELLAESSSAQARAAAVFALYRIATPRSLEGVRSALEDADVLVRTAAARCVGMARDRHALEPLKKMVLDDEPAARRQAATALGQIGDRSAVPVLLQSASHAEDRFVEHAIIYALIGLQEPQPLVQTLGRGTVQAQKAALIALDQMDGSPLKRQHVTPFFGIEDNELRRAALWVASHHPDWSGDVVRFLRERLTQGEVSDAETAALKEVLVSFCETREVQQLLAGLLGDDRRPERIQLFLLETIDECDLTRLPKTWVTGIARLLDQAGDGPVRYGALDLIRSRRMGEVSDQVEQIADRPDESPHLRTAALSALVMSRPRLSDSQFAFLRRQLDPSLEAPLRLTAAEVIGQADLSKESLLELAHEVIPRADPLILIHLLEAFRDSDDGEIGRALVDSLLSNPSGLDSFELSGVKDLLSSYPPDVQNAGKPLLARLEEVRESRIQRLHDLESQLGGGDIGQGRNVFFGKKVSCASCHTIGAQGGEVGPDLTAIGATRSRHDILESIVFPSASFVRGHEAYRVQTKQEMFSGMIKERTSDAVVLVTGADSKIRIPREEIVSMEASSVSIMPEGLDESLTQEELADLLAFLEAQN